MTSPVWIVLLRRHNHKVINLCWGIIYLTTFSRNCQHFASILAERLNGHSEFAEVPFEPASLVWSKDLASRLIHSQREIVGRFPIVKVVAFHKFNHA